MIKFTLKKSKHWNFLGGPGVKNQPSIAVMWVQLLVGETKIPHAMGLLSPRTTPRPDAGQK